MDGSYSIVGVVGHIDHGKTSLVAALTGVDTDTHPEEKRRGITIDLGFAHCRIGEKQFAFIDAPGHQRFIGNLLAGVSSVDIGLLVVACDQGIQEQTLEHVAILRQLGVPRLIVAISRTDLASEEHARELAEELRLFLSEYGFNEFPVVRVAAPSGLGLDDLRAELTAAARVGERVASQHFRLPIDRVFSVPGRGCVVAGTVWSGSVRVGDVVEIARTRQRVRVRELELHGVAVEASRVGYRTAINLSGIAARELSRGDELLAVGTHRSTTRLLIELSLFAEAPDVNCPAVVQLHTATTHCSARLVGAKRLGTPCYLVAETDQPLVATYGQRCLFRRPYPVGSFAGGKVLALLDDLPGKLQKCLLARGEALASPSVESRLGAWLECRGELDLDPLWTELELGASEPATESAVSALCESSPPPGLKLAGQLVSAGAIRRSGDYVVKLLTQQAEQSQDAWSVEDSLVERARTTGSPALVKEAIRALVDEQRVVRLNNRLAIASADTKLSKRQRGNMQKLLELFQGNRTPPGIKEVAAALGEPMEQITSLVRLAAQQGLLTEFGKGLVIDTAILQELTGLLRDRFATQTELTVSEIRELWQVSRKYAVPLLEYFDRNQWTSRHGDQRTIGSAMMDPQQD